MTRTRTPAQPRPIEQRPTAGRSTSDGPAEPKPSRGRPAAGPWVALALLLAAVTTGVVVLSPLGDEPEGSPSLRPTAGLAVQPRSSVVPAQSDVGDAGAPRALPGSVSGEGMGGAAGSVFDEQSPTVTRLDPALLDALRTAASEARADGVELHVNSGWRSAAEQEQLLEQAVARYGSEKEARRWVATPKTSAHVSGDAVDLGPSRATSWLADHGAAYGLCQVYRNEPWHYELRQGAALDGCPARYADPTQDPRMSR